MSPDNWDIRWVDKTTVEPWEPTTGQESCFVEDVKLAILTVENIRLKREIARLGDEIIRLERLLKKAVPKRKRKKTGAKPFERRILL